ncbi:hypothetical protein TNCV_627001 [Trichonephila clavipes]|nr:hypothetical protein TNCV_627001 [Trichonephila clavipes]
MGRQLASKKLGKQNEVLVNLITSKTSAVAPLKAVTLPRLELLGALVAARLSSRVQEIVRKKKRCKSFADRLQNSPYSGLKALLKDKKNNSWLTGAGDLQAN